MTGQMIPYGIDRWPSSAANVPIARRIAGEPFRLNTNRLELPPADPSSGETLARVRDIYLGRCAVWDRTSRELVHAYFELVRRQVADHRPRLAERLAPYAGLYAVEDWVFSAPAPLPRAHLATDGRNDEDRVLVDLAFVLADGVIGVVLPGSASTPKKSAERRERLRAAGVTVLEPDSAALAAPQIFLRENLPPAALLFWEGEVVPSSPLRPRLPA